MKVLLTPVLCLLFLGTAECQQIPKPPAQDTEKAEGPTSQPDLPTVKLEFSEAKAVSGVTGSPLIGNQKQCGPDGAVFVQMAVAPFYREKQVVALGGPDGSRIYSLSLVPNNLHDVTLVDYSPTSSEVAFLVRATEDAEQKEYRASTPDGKVDAGKGYRGEHHNYILIYDRKGSYKSTVDLPADAIFTRLGELEPGEFVLLGYDPVNRAAGLRLVSSSGKLLRTLQLPSKMENDASLEQGETGGAVEVAKAVAGLSHWQFTSTRGKIVLSRPGAAGVVLEVGSGGAVREVPLESPPAYELDGFVPANDRWLVRYRRKDLPERGGIDANGSSGNFVLFDVNPLDGSLRRGLELPGRSSVFGIGCESEGEVTMVGLNDKLQFQISRADIPK
jgi:urease beta subunit